MAEEPAVHQGTAITDGLQPGHDISCTPHNDSYYATKLYSELDPAQQQIRLVKLWPGTGDDVVECTLLPEASLLDKKGQYTAPSYCTGSAKNTESIVLNGTSFNVFANLAHALREIRHFWRSTYGDRECLLWIDQISINQSDLKERSHQVRFMREIYQYAEQVLVCLSTETVDPRGMNWFLELARDVRPREFDMIINAEQHPSFHVFGDVSDNQECAIAIDKDHQTRLWDHIWKNKRYKKFTEGWLAVYDIIEAPWFTRAWFFQEFIVAANVYFKYSGAFACWKTLSPLWMMIYMYQDGLVDGGRSPEMTNHPRIYGQERRNLRRVIRHVKRNEVKTAVGRMGFIIKSKATWSGDLDLKKLLAHSCWCSTTDPRDKVFAFIGLADPAYGILPNYSHPIDRILIDTTTNIIQTERSLEAL